MKRALLLFALVACSSKSSPPTAPPPAPDPGDGSGMGSAETKTETPVENKPGMGATCGDNDVCAPGYECVKYYGIAGARGPQFKTCEIRCEKNSEEAVCPKGTHCTTVADGPGQVCR